MGADNGDQNLPRCALYFVEIINVVVMKNTLLIIALSCAILCAGSYSARSSEALSTSVSVQKSKDKARKTVVFNVSMHCAKCVKKINDNIAFEKGVKDLTVSLDKKTVTVSYDPSKTDEKKLKAALEKLGYTVSTVE